MRPVPQSKHLWAALVFVAVAALAGYLASLNYRLSDAQVRIAAGALKENNPNLYPHDPVFGAEGLWRFQTPVFQSALKFLYVPTGYSDPALPFQAMTGLAVLIYLCGMYALLYQQCRSWSISVFVAVLSSTVIYTVGEAYWGIGSLGSITPAALYQAVIPLIMLAFLRHARQWRVLGVFLFVGLMGNLHSPTALNLTIVLLITYLGYRRFAPSAFAMAVGCAIAAGIGALPYTWYVFQLQTALTPQSAQSSLTAAYAAFRLAELQVTYPEALKSLLQWLLLAGVLAIPAIAVLSRVERFRTRNLRPWLYFAGAGMFVTLALGGASQAVAYATGRPPAVIDFVQASSLVMLPLYVLFAQVLTNLFRLIRTHRMWLRWICAALMTVWVMPSDNFRVGRYAALDTATMFMEEADKPSGVRKHHRDYNKWAELTSIGRWAQRNTPAGAVFLTDRSEFRILGRRGIVATTDDVRYIYYFAPWRLGPWADLVARQEQVLHPPTRTITGNALNGLAKKLHADGRFRKAGEWYMILNVAVTHDEDIPLDPISGDWGRYYRLYRLRLPEPS